MQGVERLAVEGYDEVYRVDCGGSVAFVALHAVIAGHAFGGLRIRPYATEGAALDDALALARAMSHKVVLAGIVGGGGKCVLMQPAPGVDRAACVRRLGEFIEELGGRYSTGPDLGFLPADDLALRSVTRHVACAEMAGATSRGVLACMTAVAAPLRRVAVQGLGAVGRPLAEQLTALNVDVVASDLVPVEGFRCVPPEAIYSQECDVFAPCATGGVLDGQHIARLRCRWVCGGANNPFASPADAQRLFARGIGFVPDVVSNAGATIVGASNVLGEQALVPQRLAALGPLAARLCARAAAERRSTYEVARELAEERLAAFRAN